MGVILFCLPEFRGAGSGSNVPASQKFRYVRYPSKRIYPPASLAALVIVIAWAAIGPLFDYSNTWQLVINTGTTIITFLMVFFIQHSQNRDTLAVQLKLAD